MRLTNMTCILFYFLFLIALSLLVIPSLPLDASLKAMHFFSTNLDIRNHFGGMDPGSFATGSFTIFTKGWLDGNTVWLINLWPPGFMLLQAAILKIAGANAPLAGILLMMAAAVLAIAFNAFRLALQLFVRPMFAALLPLLLLLSSQFRLFMLGQDAILFGETFSISFVLIGFFALILSCSKNSRWLAIIAGMMFALSAYFRSQFEVYFMFGTINFILIMIVITLYKKWVSKKTYPPAKALTPVLAILIALVTFHLLTIPDRIYNHIRINSFAWVQTRELIMQQGFSTTESLEKAQAHFFAAGGGNMACLTDPLLCADINKKIDNNTITKIQIVKQVILTFVKHPFRWAYLKLSILPKYWFVEIKSFLDLIYTTPNYTTIDNFIFIACFVFSMLWSICTIRNRYSFVTFWLNSSILVGYAAIFSFAHFEVRYLLFFKFYFLAATIFGLAHWSVYKSKK